MIPDEFSLLDQAAVVTGGGGGIGAATAIALAKQGAEVAILDRDLEAAQAVAKKIGGKTLAIACDVTDAGSVRAAFDATVSAFGGVDILVSNAGAAWQGGTQAGTNRNATTEVVAFSIAGRFSARRVDQNCHHDFSVPGLA